MFIWNEDRKRERGRKKLSVHLSLPKWVPCLQLSKGQGQTIILASILGGSNPVESSPLPLRICTSRRLIAGAGARSWTPISPCGMHAFYLLNARLLPLVKFLKTHWSSRLQLINYNCFFWWLAIILKDSFILYC